VIVMAELNQIYKCNICGNIVEITHAGVGTLVCCNQEMDLLKEKKTEEGKEKHLPTIKKTKEGVLVKIGSKPHPMEEKHYIEFIELLVDGQVYRKYLRPGDTPEALFKTSGKKLSARAYCNVHGLWSN